MERKTLPGCFPPRCSSTKKSLQMKLQVTTFNWLFLTVQFHRDSYLPVLELEFRNCFRVHGHCRWGYRQWPTAELSFRPLPVRQSAVAYSHRPLPVRQSAVAYSHRPLLVRQSAVAYGETQFSELKNSFWTLTLKQAHRIHNFTVLIVNL